MSIVERSEFSVLNPALVVHKKAFAQRKVPTYGEPSFIRLAILLAKIRIDVIVDTRLSFYLR